MNRFLNRSEAGKILAQQLKSYANRLDAIILALPRGGVPVAFEIAKDLMLPLDVFIVRKLGVPSHQELAMGAIASGGSIFINNAIVHELHISRNSIGRIIRLEKSELQRRELVYRGKRDFPDLAGKTIILVDDGMATGSTMYAAIKTIRKLKPFYIIVAVPVAPFSVCEEIKKVVNEVICLLKPSPFCAVGAWYVNFPQVSDGEVIDLLSKASHDLT